MSAEGVSGVSVNQQQSLSPSQADLQSRRPADSPPAGLQHNPSAGDYSGHFARLILLGATFGAGYVLNLFVGERPYFGFLVISGVILVCVGLVLGPAPRIRSARIAVPLFDLAWITFAMYLTDGASSVVLPLLYIVVAMACMRGARWEVGMTLAGAITAIFVLASTSETGDTLRLAVANATLLAAGALAIRLAVKDALPETVETPNDRLYETLLRTTSDAVLSLRPSDWHIVEANPAAQKIFGEEDAPLTDTALDEAIDFTDRAFIRTCQRLLEDDQPVVDALTHATGRKQEKLTLRCNLFKVGAGTAEEFIQAIIEVIEEPEAVEKTQATIRDDFSLNYIPSLTHELNNHLAAIRLSAELAATTGRMPNFDHLQEQVDRCQDVLQTVVLQILRSAAPVVTPERSPEADLRTVMERVLLLTRAQILTSGIHLQVDLPDAVPTVMGFAHELQEALIRIIIQSIKGMASDDKGRTLQLSVLPRTRTVDVLIVDEGTGLGARELALLSGKTIAVSRSGDRTWEVVRDAACRFGGDIRVDSGLHGGMRLRISLPVYADQQEVA